MRRFSKVLSLTFVSLSLFAVVLLATTLSNSPTSCSGQWTSCSSAFSDNSAYASTTASGKSSLWQGYGFNVPSGSTINSVSVRADFWATKTSGYIDVRVSNNGGASWGIAHRVGGVTSQTTFNIDVTSDFSWTPSGLSDANFKVNVTSVKVGSGSPTWKLDWIPVTVNYTAPAPTYPDLTLAFGDISFNPSTVNTGSSTVITAVIHNVGNAAAGAYYVRFYDSTAGTLIGYTSISGTPAGQTSNAQITYYNVPGPVGNHSITVTADYYNAVNESNEANNVASNNGLIVNAMPDLVAYGFYMTFDPSSVSVGGSTHITAVISNTGYADAGNYTVRFYDWTVNSTIGYVDVSGTLTGQNSTAEIDYTNVPGPSGNHTIEAYADWYNTVSESNENNNAGYKMLIVN